MTPTTSASKSQLTNRVAPRRGPLLFLYLTLLIAPSPSPAPHQEPTLEQRAYALDRQLMCPVCDGQTVDQSNAQVSLDMKEVIREKLTGR